ncbi:MAG: response regulator [Deltaproteobacteria bacterium]|jgi:signal transduction histidine kinase/CheY-like chemotaxis protein|nr:response regulator [Deltaproteobacteria bacterium]
MKIFLSASFFRLAAFSAAIAVLPLLCVLLVTGFMRSHQAFDIVDGRMRNFMLAVEMQQEKLNAATRALLENLAETDAIKARDLDLCASLFTRLQDKITLYSNFALYDEHGTLLAAAGGAAGEPGNVPEEFLRGGQDPAVDAGGVPGKTPAYFHPREKFNVFFLQNALVSVYALSDAAGRENGYLAAFMHIPRQLERVERLGLPAGFALHFLTADARPVWRFAADPEHTEVPADAGGIVAASPGSSQNSILTVKGENGGAILFTFAGLHVSALSEPYMYVALSVSEKLAYFNIRSGIMNSLGAVAAGSGLTLLLLWSLCFCIFKRPAARLLDVAKKLGQGDFAAREALSPLMNGVFGDYAAALRHTAEVLEKDEAELRGASAIAKQAGQAKSEFLANMSHEIRTPLNAILGMTYLVLKSNLGVGQRGYVNKIQVASKNLLHVVNDILDFSKMEAGKMGMEQIRFAVRDLFSNLAMHYSSRAQESGIQFEMHIAPEVPMYLVGDPLRLEQAIGHLLENAFRKTWKGFVRLSCSVSGIVRSECALRIAISDTGEGLSPEELADLREAFSGGTRLTEGAGRLPGETSRTGPVLGLAIAQRLFEFMNGSIEVNSEAGRGSTFTCMARFIYREDDQSRHSIILAGKSILIADSDEISLALYTSMLSNFSMASKSCVSAAEALKELVRADAEGEGYDYFMLDWRNLELDIGSLLRQIKQDLKLVKTPHVLALSDTGRDEARKLAESAGADVFLHKPVDASVLLDTLMGLCSGSEISAMGLAVSEAIAKMARQTVEGLRVLLVEDNVLNQQLAQEFMSYQGIHVTVAASGSKALTAIADTFTSGENPYAKPFDIVLMDLQMPEMDGFEATWRIRNDSHLQASHMPVIAMTAHSNPEEINACRKAGMDDYVGKPIDVNLFFEALHRWLPILPDKQSIIAGDFKNMLELIQAQAPRALAMFASLQEVLTCFIGEGRLKKLQKLLWDNAWEDALDFALYLQDSLYPQSASPAAASGEGTDPLPPGGGA